MGQSASAYANSAAAQASMDAFQLQHSATDEASRAFCGPPLSACAPSHSRRAVGVSHAVSEQRPAQQSSNTSNGLVSAPGSSAGPELEHEGALPRRTVSPQRIQAAINLYFGPDTRGKLEKMRREDEERRREEGAGEYKKGGYLEVCRGQVYSHRYLIIRKLGWGHFSTVWLVADLASPQQCSTQPHRQYAIKFQKGDPTFLEAAIDEVKLLERVRKSNDAHIGKRFVVELADHFKVRSTFGQHMCLVFEVLGESLLSVLKRSARRRVPLPVVQRLAYDMLTGVDYLHRECGVIHTDLKLENILVAEPRDGLAKQLATFEPSPTGDVPGHRRRSHSVSETHSTGPSTEQAGVSPGSPNLLTYRRPLVKVADLGNGCWTHHHFSDYITTRQYRAPEVILRAEYSTGADIWSIACIVFEMVTGDYLFDPKASRSRKYTRNDDHLALMIEMLGPMPETLLRRSKERDSFFNRDGYLLRLSQLDSWSLPDVLETKHGLTRGNAQALANFLLPMLSLDPDHRASARQMLQSEWLHDVREQLERPPPQLPIVKSAAPMKKKRPPRRLGLGPDSALRDSTILPVPRDDEVLPPLEVQGLPIVTGIIGQGEHVVVDVSSLQQPSSERNHWHAMHQPRHDSQRVSKHLPSRSVNVTVPPAVPPRSAKGGRWGAVKPQPRLLPTQVAAGSKQQSESIGVAILSKVRDPLRPIAISRHVLKPPRPNGAVRRI